MTREELERSLIMLEKLAVYKWLAERALADANGLDAKVFEEHIHDASSNARRVRELILNFFDELPAKGNNIK